MPYDPHSPASVKPKMDARTDLMNKLVQFLQQLDAEATPLPNGTPVGLWWYACHTRRDEQGRGKNYRNEEDWSRRLEELLEGDGILAKTEVKYPKSFPRRRRRCDLVFEWPGLGTTWLEVKGAWCHSDFKGLKWNKSYAKHIVAAADDVDKLLSLTQPTTEQIGLMLVAFDTKGDPIPEIDIEGIRGRMTASPWHEQYRRWDDSYRSNGQIHVWLWLRRVDANAP